MGIVPSPPRRPSVLVVEDDPELRTLYRTTLALAGFAVTSAEDGIEALRRIDAGPPDVIVLDFPSDLVQARLHREFLALVPRRRA